MLNTRVSRLRQDETTLRLTRGPVPDCGQKKSATARGSDCVMSAKAARSSATSVYARPASGARHNRRTPDFYIRRLFGKGPADEWV
jgi:hypothetical protein